MAPAGDYKADVAILEGTEFISTGAITSGMNLLSSGKVKRIVIVLQNIAPAHRPYGINGNYPDIVKQKLNNLGMKETEFKVIVVPIRHPVTLKEAEAVLKTLSKENIKSAILLSPGFHTRRSYLAYQHVGIPLQIRIFPSASFTNYQANNWWIQEPGVRDFTATNGRAANIGIAFWSGNFLSRTGALRPLRTSTCSQGSEATARSTRPNCATAAT